MNKLNLTLLAVGLSASCLSVNALEIDTLDDSTFFTNGKLTVNVTGACKGKVTLDNIELHTYNPMYPQSSTIAAYDGDTFVNNYGFVLADASGNIVAAYAPARMVGSTVTSNGITVQKFTQNINEATSAYKSTMQLQAAQDDLGAVQTLMNYLGQYHDGSIKCADMPSDYSPLNESASTFSLTDTSNDTATKYSYKTQFKAKSVAGAITETETPKGKTRIINYQTSPLTINVSFAASGSGNQQ